MDQITSELLDAAQCGEAAVLKQIDGIEPRYLKVILAAIALSLSPIAGAKAPSPITSLR
jgi:hypothetical protein